MFHQAQVEREKQVGEQNGDMGLAGDFQGSKDNCKLQRSMASKRLIAGLSEFFPDCGKS